MSTDLERRLAESTRVMREQQEELERIAKAPHMFGTVLEVRKDRIIVATTNGTIEMEKPSKPPLTAGTTVLIHQQTGAVINATEPVPVGAAVVVSNVAEDCKTARIVADGHEMNVMTGNFGANLKEGDLAVTDATNSVIVKVFPREKKTHDFTKPTGVTWDDIGGQEEAKAQMIEAVETPFTQAKVYKFYNKKPLKGIMMYGPPGCGKTMLAKAAATAIGKMSGNTHPAAFMYVKGPEVLDPYVGVAEATVRGLFRRAKDYKEATGTPAVIFIDEADALLSSRNSRHAFMEKTIVPTFLAEMDGLDESNALVILATNRPDSLDPAVTREGRMDRKVLVARPTQSESKSIFELYLKKTPLAKGVKLDYLAEIGSRTVFSDDLTFLEVLMHSGEKRRFALADIVSGSLIAGIVDQATSIAMHEDIANNKTNGLTGEHLMRAVHYIFEQNRHVNHVEHFEHFTNGQEIAHIRRL